MKIPSIIVDLDGTLANAKHRLHHIQKDPKDWDAFFRDSHMDTPNEWCVSIIDLFKPSVEILFVTGRGEEDREGTCAWIEKHLGTGFFHRNSTLLMRPAKDRRPDTEVKSEIYRELIEPYYNVIFAIDDRASVARMWRSIGIPTLLCDDWEDHQHSHHQEVAKYFLEKR